MAGCVATYWLIGADEGVPPSPGSGPLPEALVAAAPRRQLPAISINNGTLGTAGVLATARATDALAHCLFLSCIGPARNATLGPPIIGPTWPAANSVPRIMAKEHELEGVLGPSFPNWQSETAYAHII